MCVPSLFICLLTQIVLLSCSISRWHLACPPSHSSFCSDVIATKHLPLCLKQTPPPTPACILSIPFQNGGSPRSWDFVLCTAVSPGASDSAWSLLSSQNTWWMRVVVLSRIRCSLQVPRFCLRNVFKSLLSHIHYTFLSVSLFLLVSELLRFRDIISVASITINVSVMFPRLQPSLASSSPSNLVALFS